MKARDAGSLPLFQTVPLPVPDLPFPASGKPDLAHEAWFAGHGCDCVCGTDEAGRGPLAGPVVAAAVVLDPARPIQGLDDSKALSHSRREALFADIMDKARAVTITTRSAETIDATDIRKASLDAMRTCVLALPIRPNAVLSDGRDEVPMLAPEIICKALVKGDARSASIAAASIIAKVVRDRMMACEDAINPAYGLGSHMGYAAKRHRDEIAASGGIVRVHRFSFSPLKGRT